MNVLTIEELLKTLGGQAKKLPLGLKTPISEIWVDNLHTSGPRIYPGKFKPDIGFYRDKQGNITLSFMGC